MREKTLQIHLARVLCCCTSLRRLSISSGHLNNLTDFLSAIPPGLRSLQLHSVETTSNKIHNRRGITGKNFNFLDLSGCSWIQDGTLRPLLGHQLQHLDLHHCYRLFLGPPLQIKLSHRLERLAFDLGTKCPNLKVLRLRSVFTLPLITTDPSLMVYGLLNKLVDPFPRLSELDLSCNRSLTDYIADCVRLNGETTLDSFISRLMASTNTPIRLGLSEWPRNCVQAVLSAATRVMSSYSPQLSLVVNEELSENTLMSSFDLPIVFIPSVRRASRKRTGQELDPPLSASLNPSKRTDFLLF